MKSQFRRDESHNIDGSLCSSREQRPALYAAWLELILLLGDRLVLDVTSDSGTALAEKGSQTV